MDVISHELKKIPDPVNRIRELKKIPDPVNRIRDEYLVVPPFFSYHAWFFLSSL